MAANILKKLGYAEPHNLGGLHHWAAAGGAVIR
jgi:rhodanese-related sulfurtransferase